MHGRSDGVNDERRATDVLFTPLHHDVVTPTVSHRIRHAELVVTQMLDVHFLTGYNWPRDAYVQHIISCSKHKFRYTSYTINICQLPQF